MAFCILGHGVENIEEEREEMPDGTYLVTMTECGRLVSDVDLYAVLDVLRKDPATTPEAFPEEIRRRFRIYTPGMEYPFLSASLFTSHDTKKPDEQIIEKSGVFPIPLPFETMSVGRVKSTHQGKYVENTEGVIDKAYEGSLLSPPLEEIKKIYGTELPVVLLAEPVPLKTIFSRFGQGVYYFPLCRGVTLPYNVKELYRNMPPTINRFNNVAVREYLLPFVTDPRNKKTLEKQIFTMKVLRPRSAEKHKHAKKKGGKRRTRRLVRR